MKRLLPFLVCLLHAAPGRAQTLDPEPKAAAAEPVLPTAPSAEAAPAPDAPKPAPDAPKPALEATKPPGADSTGNPSTPYPDASVAPPTAAGRRVLAHVAEGVEVLAGAEIVGAYVFRHGRVQDGSRQWFHLFDLPRLHLALGAQTKHASGRVVLESIRSTADGALTGVGGDSLVTRLREAYASARSACPTGEAEFADGTCERALRVVGALGLVPTLTAAEIDGTALMSTIQRSAVERERWMSPADLGATVRGSIGRYATLSGGLFNGEGYDGRELNRGKNAEVALSLRPFVSRPMAPLSLFGSLGAGSTGIALARAERWTAGVFWHGSHVRGGALFSRAFGIADDGAKTGRAIDGFVRGELPFGLTLDARVGHVARDTRVAGDAYGSFVGFVGYRLSLFEFDVVVDHQVPASVMRDSILGSDRTEIRALGRFVL